MAPLLAIGAALVIIAVAIGLLDSGAASAFWLQPNTPAIQTAGALASLHQHATATTRAQQATQQALDHAAPYTPAGVGPCDRKDAPFSITSPFYWGWDYPDVVKCASDGVTTEIDDGGALYFYGQPGGFPTNFQVSVVMRFKDAGASNCAALEADSETQVPTSTGARFCADGTFTTSHAPGGQSDSQPIAVSAQYVLTMTAQQQKMSIYVNGRMLFADAPYTGPTEFLVMGETGGPLFVSNFTLTAGRS